MKHTDEGTHEDLGWAALFLLVASSLPLAALVFLVLRTLLIPVVVVGVVIMALFALFAPPPVRDWIKRDWHLSRR